MSLYYRLLIPYLYDPCNMIFFSFLVIMNIKHIVFYVFFFLLFRLNPPKEDTVTHRFFVHKNFSLEINNLLISNPKNNNLCYKLTTVYYSSIKYTNLLTSTEAIFCLYNKLLFFFCQ